MRRGRGAGGRIKNSKGAWGTWGGRFLEASPLAEFPRTPLGGSDRNRTVVARVVWIWHFGNGRDVGERPLNRMKGVRDAVVEQLCEDGHQRVL